MSGHIDRQLEGLVQGLSAHGRRWLIWGPPGAGKTTLAASIADALVARGMACVGIAADPGSPGFGVPGAVARARRRAGAWEVERIEALCALDAVRYRLPLVLALARLLADGSPRASESASEASLPVREGGPGRGRDGASDAHGSEPVLLVDAPGVVRGPAAGELLSALLETVRAEGVLAILPQPGSERDAALRLLETVPAPVLTRPVSPLARRRGKRERAAARTALWDAWLESAEPARLDLAQLRPAGAVPHADDWRGRQLALLDGSGGTLALGEGGELVGDGLHALLRPVTAAEARPAVCLLRDARRDGSGRLTTERRGDKAVAAAIPPELASPGAEPSDPACFAHLGIASLLLVNGVFGDPLLHLRLRQQRRSLLFDLGDSARLPAKIVHQVTDVFVTHGHMDHIGGFLWFLRSRIGETRTCRLYGPKGLAGHIAGFVAGVRWDRIGDRGPRFEVHELDGDRLHVTRIQVGLGAEKTCERPAADGLLLTEPRFRVRAATLDHGIPVLAFAFEAAAGIRIRKDRLGASGLPDGPWVGELKRRLMGGEEGAVIRLPDGRSETAAGLARDLVANEPARRLAYATDLADTSSNRERLVALARGADVLICEAAFTTPDADQARRTGHLTARACGEIAAAAGVGRLIPFHFSRRYETDPGPVYAEVRAGFGRALDSGREAERGEGARSSEIRKSS